MNLEHILNKQFKTVEITKNSASYFNCRCHLNSINYAFNKNSEINKGHLMEPVEVYLCFSFVFNTTKNKLNTFPIIHFINKENGEYLDNTFGWYSRRCIHYLVCEIKENKYNSIGKYFNKKHLYKLLTNLNIFEKLYLLYKLK